MSERIPQIPEVLAPQSQPSEKEKILTSSGEDLTRLGTQIQTGKLAGEIQTTLEAQNIGDRIITNVSPKLSAFLTHPNIPQELKNSFAGFNVEQQIASIMNSNLSPQAKLVAMTQLEASFDKIASAQGEPSTQNLIDALTSFVQGVKQGLKNHQEEVELVLQICKSIAMLGFVLFIVFTPIAIMSYKFAETMVGLLLVVALGGALLHLGDKLWEYAESPDKITALSHSLEERYANGTLDLSQMQNLA